MPRGRVRKTCDNCRVSRTACYTGPAYKCCYRCDAKGLTFSGGEPLKSREDNDRSELLAQLTRFGNILHTLKKEGLEMLTAEELCGPIPSTSGEFLDASPDVVEINDLIGGLTKLCFRHGSADGPRTKLDQHELVEEAQTMILATCNNLKTPASGFVFTPPPAQSTLQDIIHRLPSATEVSRLFDIFSNAWMRVHGLFWPTWPICIAEWLDNGCKPEPHPHLLAELFGVLAMACSIAQTDSPAAKWQSQVDHYADLLQKALRLGNYVEEPSLQSITALCLLSELYLSCSSCTSRLARGLAILPVAFAGANQLGYHAPESAFHGRETPEERFQRRAVVSKLLRNDWAYSYIVGRPALVHPRSWPFEFPEAPRDEDLPLPAARDSAWRLTPILLHGLRASVLTTQLQQEIVMEVFGNPKGVVYANVRKYADKVDALWHELVLPGWRFYDDPITGVRHWGDPSDANRVLPLDEAYARICTMATLQKLMLCIHRPFVQPEAMAVDGAVDYAWHRSVVLDLCRNYMCVLREASSALGTFRSVLSASFDAIVAICVLIFSNPDSPDIVQHREEMARSIAMMANAPTAPPAVIKLGRIASFLLDRPQVRKAEQRAEHQGEQRASKRRYKWALIKAFDAPPRLKLSSQCDAMVNCCFEPALPLQPVVPTNRDSTLGNFDLRHKTPERPLHRTSIQVHGTSLTV